MSQNQEFVSLDSEVHQAWVARVFEEMVQTEIYYANQMAKHQKYPDEKPVQLFPTTQFTAEQLPIYSLFKDMLVRTGLPVYICHILAESHDTFHRVQVIARCELKFRVFHLTCDLGKYSFTCSTQNTYDPEIKLLHMTDAKDDCKIFDLTSIFKEDDTRKWAFKTHALWQAERKYQRYLSLTFMTASHPRARERTALAKLDRDLLEAIARLSLS